MCDIGVFFSYTAVRTSDFEFDSWHLGPVTHLWPRGVPVAVPPRPQRRSARSQVVGVEVPARPLCTDRRAECP